MPKGGSVTERDALRAPLQRDAQVAGPAQQPVILEAALAAAIGDRNDMIGLPPWPRGAPARAGRAIGRRRFGSRPFAVRFDDVEAAQSADAPVALLDLAAHVPRAAAYLPFVHAGVA